MADPNQFIGFTEKQADRIAAAVKKVEGKRSNETGNQAGGRQAGVGTVLKGKLTSDLVYDDSQDPSTWTATFSTWMPEDIDDDDSDEAANTDYDDLTVWPWCMPSPTTISSGTEVVIAWMNGRWYVIEPGQQNIIRFELTSDLLYAQDYPDNEDTGSESESEGSDDEETGNAVILEWDGSEYTQSETVITVVDMTNSESYGTWCGLAATDDNPGYQGFAVYRSDRKAYEILWMESPAQYIQFALDDNLSAGSESSDDAQVMDFWDGRNPDPDSEGLTVYNLSSADDLRYQFYGLEGGLGYAVLENIPGQAIGNYNIIRLETPAKKINFTLTAPITSGSFWQSDGATVNSWYDGTSPGETADVYDIDVTFQNAPTGAKGKAIWNEHNEQYEIVVCQMKATFISGTISGTLTKGGSATCNVANAWGGLNPGSSLTVTDISGQFSATTSGQAYQATYSKENDQYRFTWVAC